MSYDITPEDFYENYRERTIGAVPRIIVRSAL